MAVEKMSAPLRMTCTLLSGPIFVKNRFKSSSSTTKGNSNATTIFFSAYYDDDERWSIVARQALQLETKQKQNGKKSRTQKQLSLKKKTAVVRLKVPCRLPIL
jgi:hypothetical protein